MKLAGVTAYGISFLPDKTAALRLKGTRSSEESNADIKMDIQAIDSQSLDSNYLLQMYKKHFVYSSILSS